MPAKVDMYPPAIFAAQQRARFMSMLENFVENASVGLRLVDADEITMRTTLGGLFDSHLGGYKPLSRLDGMRF